MHAAKNPSTNETKDTTGLGTRLVAFRNISDLALLQNVDAWQPMECWWLLRLRFWCHEHTVLARTYCITDDIVILNFSPCGLSREESNTLFGSVYHCYVCWCYICSLQWCCSARRKTHRKLTTPLDSKVCDFVVVSEKVITMNNLYLCLKEGVS